jgi:hypothetical protein
MTVFTRNRPALALGIAAAAAATIAAASAGHASTTPVPTLLRDGLASTDPFNAHPPTADKPVQPDTEVEPSIGVNPTNPSNVVAAFQVGRVDGGGDADNGFATSADGGQTWTDGLLPGLTKDGPHPGPFDRASDAVVAFGPDGTVYANSLVFDDTSSSALPSGMAVNVSKDGGKTWSDAVILESDPGDGLNDKNWIVVDQSGASGHHKGRVYVVWDRVASVEYSYCDTACDVAGNWSSDVTAGVSGQTNGWYTLYAGQGIGSIPLILNDGSLMVVFQSLTGNPITVNTGDQPNFDPNGRPIVQVTAPSAGNVVWPAPLTFIQAPITVGVYHSANGVPEQRAGSLPTAAVDPVSNQVYVGWEDSSFRTQDGRNDAVFVTSTDGGTTWTPAKKIDPDTDGSHLDDYNTALAVGKDGIVRAMYRQRLELGSTFSKTVDTLYSQSADGGKTWSAPLKVDTQSTNVDYAAFSRGGAFEGDYNQLAPASDGTTYVVRDEAYPRFPGAPCSCSFTTVNDREHQTTWVAVVSPNGLPAAVPETRWAPALVLLAAAIAVAAARRRRPRPARG